MENVNRTRVLKAARDLFNTRGYRSVTIQDLAGKLGMSKKTVYQYFSSKEEIATAVVEESMEKVRQVLSVSDRSQSDPLLEIKEILIHVKDESIRFGPLFLMDIEKYLPELSNRYKRLRHEGNQYIVQLFTTAQHIGLIKQNIPIDQVVEILRTCLRALVNTHAFSESRYSIEQKLDLFLDIFCKGIANSGRDD
ncbi:TetR/AcrR family transcriptional regulator [Paenibacillus alkalitolerans]|uniref:TetR/AcrR family transcriptional regulator n=1 Tax=Paenibacillus alkalitolerans TaxID=2799335 RepID=UPI0018F295E2|nr:TetR/AcrR family transcriptional regulator [Paenibacillus alkalitolerans]